MPSLFKAWPPAAARGLRGLRADLRTDLRAQRLGTPVREGKRAEKAPGHWALGTRHWALGTGHWHCTGNWALGTGNWAGNWELGTGYRGGIKSLKLINYLTGIRPLMGYAWDTHLIRIAHASSRLRFWRVGTAEKDGYPMAYLRKRRRVGKSEPQRGKHARWVPRWPAETNSRFAQQQAAQLDVSRSSRVHAPSSGRLVQSLSILLSWSILAGPSTCRVPA
eukprot:gene24276-biopygen7384